MRHRIGGVLALVMFATLFFDGGWGYFRLLRLPGPGGELTGLPAGGGQLFSDPRTVTALIAVAGTGLLAGILVAVPLISPLAAGLPGLVLLGWTGLYLGSVRQAVDLIPLRSDAFGAGFEAMLYNGTLAAAGFAMIVPMLLPSRWRRRVSTRQPGLDEASNPIVAGDTMPDPVIQPTAIRAPATRMERVVPARSESEGDPESPWLVALRATARPHDDT